MDATIAAVSLYKYDDLKEVDITLSSDLKDYNIHTSDAMKDDFRKQIQEKYVTALVTQLTSRLPDVVELEAFSVLDPSKLPQESAEGYTTYGNDHLDLLCSRYGSVDKADISIEELRSEWVALKQLLSQKYREMECKEFLIWMSSDGILTFPNFALLATIALIIPVSTAECERCFSSMKRIKTTLRNRMETATLDQLMRTANKGHKAEEFNLIKQLTCGGCYSKEG